MQNFRRLIGALLLILAAGCVRSLHPLYSEQDVIFDSKLVGLWSVADSKETFEFSKQGERGYQLVYDDGGKSGTFDVYLLKIDGKLFLDLFPRNPQLNENAFYKFHLVPVHNFLHVTQIEPNLQIRSPGYNWLNDFLVGNPKAIRYEKIDRDIILTASTRELQTFWLKHLDTKDAFGEPVNLMRMMKAVSNDQSNKPDTGGARDAAVGDVNPGPPATTATRAADIPCLESSVTVKVTLSEGKIAVDTQTVEPTNRIIFEVKNATDKLHHVVVVETDLPPDKLPVTDGRVRYFTYFDEPHKMLIHDGGGRTQQVARGATPPWSPQRREPGGKVPPGKTAVLKEVFRYDYKFMPGTTFVLFCNESGHYEKGEYASLVVK